MNDAQRQQHERHRDVWGVEQAEQTPGQVPTAEQLHGVRPLDIAATPSSLEHDDHCTAGPERTEAVTWSNGQTATRCLDCTASALTPWG